MTVYILVEHYDISYDMIVEVHGDKTMAEYREGYLNSMQPKGSHVHYTVEEFEVI